METKKIRFDHSLPMQLYYTLDAVMPGYRALFARFGVTEQQWRVLRVLWDEEAIPLNALAARSLLQAPSLVGIIDRLEEKGLVERRRSAKDRRQVNIVATAAGHKLQEQVLPEVNALHDDIAALVNETEWSELSRILGKIQKGLAAEEIRKTA